MLIFQESQNVTKIDDLRPVIVEDYFWVMDLENKDFMIEPLNVIEATRCPSIELLVDGFQFIVPSTWNILIVDPETSQLDISDVGSVIGKNFHAFCYGFNSSMTEMHNIEAVDYHPDFVSFSPVMNKNHMLCHPIDKDRWINLSPADSYNKHFRSTLLSGDFV